MSSTETVEHPSGYLRTILGKLNKVRRCGTGWTARCPAHDDHTSSLSIGEADGKILVYCHAQCSHQAICEALGIKPADLFPDSSGRKVGRQRNDAARSESSPSSEPIAVYDYFDEAGKLLYQNCRYAPKDFRWRRPDGHGGYIWKLDGARRVPYNLPQILRADFVLIAEGEKDADTATKLGFAATNSKSWKPEWSEYLRNKKVAIIADADEPGRKIANVVAESLVGKTSSLKLLELPGDTKGFDLSDWVGLGGSRDALQCFIDKAEEKGGIAWRDIFHTFTEFENAAPLNFAIKDFLQNDGVTLIGGPSGHGKTFILLSVIKALLAGPGHKLWGCFDVLERAERVIYLIPESAIGPFGHRLKLFGLYDYLQNDRLLVRTLSKGPAPSLLDPRILFAAKGAHVVLDTAVRFSAEGSENDASDNQRGLATDLFSLLGAGVRTIQGAHHSPKSFSKEAVMTLENVLRGSGDIGAMVATAWGIKQIDRDQNIIHIENIKPRDFEPPKPFQLAGRPFIDEIGDLSMYKKPGECGSLADEQEPDRDKGGASAQARESRASNIALVREWLTREPDLTSDELVARFREVGVQVARSTVRKYRQEITGK